MLVDGRLEKPAERGETKFGRINVGWKDEGTSYDEQKGTSMRRKRIKANANERES